MHKYALAVMLLTLGGLVNGTENPPRASDDAASMDNARLGKLINSVADEIEGEAGFWKFTLDGHRIMVITDETANRMRIIVPVTQAEEVDKALLYRLMQANFDTALDARYAIAQGLVWSAYIHPLAELDDAEFVSALGQTVNLAENFGDSYSSGALVFGGGDSKSLRDRERIERLLEKALSI